MRFSCNRCGETWPDHPVTRVPCPERPSEHEDSPGGWLAESQRRWSRSLREFQKDYSRRPGAGSGRTRPSRNTTPTEL